MYKIFNKTIAHLKFRYIYRLKQNNKIMHDFKLMILQVPESFLNKVVYIIGSIELILYI